MTSFVRLSNFDNVVTATKTLQANETIEGIKTLQSVPTGHKIASCDIKKGNQVMVFVHSRKDTVKTGHVIADWARKHGTTGLLDCTMTGTGMDLAKKKISKSRNADMKELFEFGITIGFALY